MNITNPAVPTLLPPPADITARPNGEARVFSPTQTTSVSERQKTAADKSSTEPDPEALKETVQQLNAALSNFGLEFSLSEADNRVITRVIDRETGELIRQIPSEEALRMAQSLEKLSGLLLQNKA